MAWMTIPRRQINWVTKMKIHIRNKSIGIDVAREYTLRGWQQIVLKQLVKIILQ